VQTKNKPVAKKSTKSKNDSYQKVSEYFAKDSIYGVRFATMLSRDGSPTICCTVINKSADGEKVYTVQNAFNNKPVSFYIKAKATKKFMEQLTQVIALAKGE
jgi:hypothetical protein